MGRNALADIPGNFFSLGFETPSVASNVNAVTSYFVAPANLAVLSAWRINGSVAECTKGTATSSASYRRFQLTNYTQTTTLASLNQTIVLAAHGSRALTLGTTVSASKGDVLALSAPTVGAASADATVMEAGSIHVAYELL